MLRPWEMMRDLRKTKISENESIIRDCKGRSLLWGLGGIFLEPVETRKQKTDVSLLIETRI